MNYLLAAVTAALLILAFPRFDLAFLAAVALAPLLVAVARERRHVRRFLVGWLAGIIYWAGVCYWIRVVLAVHGGMALWASWLAFALFGLIKALHLGVFALAAGLVIGRWWALLAVPAVWVAVERTHGSLGFAWLALGNAGINMGVPMRLAPFTGVYGISFLFAMMGTALALAALRRPRRQLAWLLALPLLYLLPPLPAVTPRTSHAAVLVQPNISETADWTPAWVAETHRKLIELSLQAGYSTKQPTLLVWPEAPAPMYYDEDLRFRNTVDDLAQRTNSYVLLNVVPHDAAGAPLNSALVVSPQGRPLGRYDKMNLVPFGEYVPRLFKSLVAKISTEPGDFAAGRRQTVLPAGEHGIGAFVCYESVFPDFVRKFAKLGGEVLVNISNDGWYGRTAARNQHLKIVRMRAAENRRWILRATNDGITSTIDPAGRVYVRLPSYTEGVERTGYSYEKSLTVYSRFGDWFAWACTAGAIIGLGLPPALRRGKRERMPAAGAAAPTQEPSPKPNRVIRA